MHVHFLFFTLLLTFGACQSPKKTTTTSKDALSNALLELGHQEIENMAGFILGKTIKQLQTSIPIEEQQESILVQHPKFQKIVQHNQKQFTTWLAQQTTLQETTKKEAIACLQQASTPELNCTHNPILQYISEAFFSEMMHEIGNYSVQLVLDKNWIPANEVGYDCTTVQTGNFYYYMPGGSSEVVYVTRTDSSQRESLEGEMTNRRVTWADNCRYSLTAWEPTDDFQLDFEIVHVASDHYLFLCKAPYKGEETTLLLGRVNKSLE